MFIDEIQRSKSYRDDYSDLNDKVKNAISKSRRLLVPEMKFMNFYKTIKYPSYDLTSIKVNLEESNLESLEGLNFSIVDKNLLFEPIRVFIDKNIIYLGHLPKELSREISLFLVNYLESLKEVVRCINLYNRYQYFSWDIKHLYNLSELNRVINFIDKTVTLKLDENLSKLCPEDTPKEEQVSFYYTFKTSVLLYYVDYLLSDEI